MVLFSGILPVVAHDVIKINRGQSVDDHRTDYTFTVLKHALDLGIEKFGTYEIQLTGSAMPNHRTYFELLSGKHLNVTMALTTDKWEKNTLPIKIPIRRGIFNYRLLAINKNNAEIFKSIQTVDDLKTLKVGVRVSWTMQKMLISMGFNVVSSYSYESTFAMLDKERFDYIIRGIHEAYDEIQTRNKTLTNLTIEPEIAIYSPNPFYMFVSPKTPEIAERLTWGLEKMVADGSLKRLFEDFYLNTITKADLGNRRIIYLGNPILPKTVPFHRTELWHDFGLTHETSLPAEEP